MPDFNQITLAGRLTNNPELRYTQGGTPVCEFTLAVNRQLGADKKESLFIGCLSWEKQAEIVSRYLQKGSSVLLSGYLRQENWQTKDGEKRTTFKVVCQNIQFLDSKRKEETAGNAPAKPTTTTPTGHKYSREDIPSSMQNDPHIEDFKDDIPF